MRLFAGLPPFRPPAPTIQTPDDALVEALLLAADADALDERANRADPSRTVPPVTDMRELAVRDDDDPGKLRGGAELLRGSARRMVAVLPAWRDAQKRLA